MMREIAAMPVTSAEYVRANRAAEKVPYTACLAVQGTKPAALAPVFFVLLNDTHGNVYRRFSPYEARTEHKNVTSYV
ncbi:hypothetical protein D1159_15055 [Pseudoflavonifractor sp. 524-17]|nr:hypothetical protein [Pseudoflavonifractor sp. 524-17]